mmetsp:Transcript_9489/g.28578  ORF Transcript_9489/g.28578 Transcript_9489/m.28578 type:complete len:217 (-) Transcript_9489:280-930(-)
MDARYVAGVARDLLRAVLADACREIGALVRVASVRSTIPRLMQINEATALHAVLHPDLAGGTCEGMALSYGTPSHLARVYDTSPTDILAMLPWYVSAIARDGGNPVVADHLRAAPPQGVLARSAWMAAPSHGPAAVPGLSLPRTGPLCHPQQLLGGDGGLEERSRALAPAPGLLQDGRLAHGSRGAPVDVLRSSGGHEACVARHSRVAALAGHCLP